MIHFYDLRSIDLITGSGLVINYNIHHERLVRYLKDQDQATATAEPFECCVCLEENTKEIKKCKNKHTDKICQSCAMKMDRCPICRERRI